MISALTTGWLYQASAELIKRENPDKPVLLNLPFSAFSVEQPISKIEFDLNCTTALKLSPLLKREPAWIAGELARDVSELAKSNDRNSFFETVEATDNGYINFKVASWGIQEVLRFIFSLAKELEPRDHGKLARSIKMVTAKKSVAVEKIDLMTDCSAQCARFIKEARQPRFDVENKTELPPLIGEGNESAFLRTAVESVSEILNDPNWEQRLNATEHHGQVRSLIIGTELLADDLVSGGVIKPGGNAEIELLRLLRHGTDLATHWQEYFANSSLIGSDDGVTRLRLALILASGRLVGYTSTLLQLIKQKQ